MSNRRGFDLPGNEIYCRSVTPERAWIVVIVDTFLLPRVVVHRVWLTDHRILSTIYSNDFFSRHDHISYQWASYRNVMVFIYMIPVIIEGILSTLLEGVFPSLLRALCVQELSNKDTHYLFSSI